MPSRWEAIRQAAAHVRAEFIRQGEQGQLAHPCLDVRAVAEVVFRLEARRDGYLPADVHAVLDPEGEAIRIHPRFDEHSTRFLISHELGHAQLEGLSSPIVDRPQDVNPDVTGLFETEQGVLRGYNTRERREQEANLFGVELLIPADQLWQDLQDQSWSEQALVERYGAPIEAIRSQIINVCLFPPQQVARRSAGVQRPMTLDQAQQAAVSALLPVLVLAGPGSGKTRSMVHRYRAMVDAGIDPQHILVLTFSNKAAEEIRARLIAELPQMLASRVGNINVFTFHAFGLELIRRYFERLQLPPNVTLLTRGEAYILCKRNLDQLPLTHFKSLNQPAQYLADLLSRIGRAKEELITPERYARRLTKELRRRNAETQALLSHRLKAERDKGERRQREAAKLHELGMFYTAYQQLLRDNHALDFGDLVMLPVLLFHRTPDVAAEVRQDYQYILVDEYQDINYANGKLVQVIDGGRQQVWAVGDPCQSIYRFRGATPVHVRRFRKVYQRAPEPIFLDRNYRSLSPIIRASDAIVRGSPPAARRPAMVAHRRQRFGGRMVEEIVASSESQELAAIGQMIRRLVPAAARRHGPRQDRARRPRYRYSDIAVLCYKHEQAAAVAATLRAMDIPVEHVGKLLDLPACKDLLALCTLVRSGDRSGLIRMLTTEDYRLSQADLDVLQPDGVEVVGGLWHVLTRYAEVPGLSAAGQQTIARLADVVADLNAQPTPWHMLLRYLCDHSASFRHQLAAASTGDSRAQRTVNQIAQLLMLARNVTRPSLVVDDPSPAGFVQYIRELEEAGQASKVPELTVDVSAVRIMTAHSSKGLEFPVVFVPYLAAGAFPPNPPPSSGVPDLDWLVWGGGGDREEENRHLCYVAMSRAKDRLVLLRSLAYGGKRAARSTLLPDPAPWHQRVLAPVADVARRAAFEERLAPDRGPMPPISVYALQTYRNCPRRYLYREVYGLRGRSRATSRVARCVRRAVDRIVAQMQATGVPLSQAEVDAIVDAVWQEMPINDLPYVGDYRTMVHQRVHASVQRYTDSNVTVEAFRQEVVVALDEGGVVIQIDQVEQRPGGSVFLLAFDGEPKQSHRTDARTILAAHHYQQQYGMPPRVELHYAGIAEPQPVQHQTNTVPTHIADMNAALRGIKERRFPAQPETRHACATCPFNLICAV